MFNDFETDYLKVTFTDDKTACFVKYNEGFDPNEVAITLEELEELCADRFGYPCVCDFVDSGEDGEEVHAVSRA